MSKEWTGLKSELERFVVCVDEGIFTQITRGCMYKVVDECDGYYNVINDDEEECTYPKYCFKALEGKDNVNHPDHYTKGKYEPIDVIHDWKLGFNLGNAIKYIARHDHKGANIEDLEKAVFYIEYEIKKLKEL